MRTRYLVPCLCISMFLAIAGTTLAQGRGAAGAQLPPEALDDVAETLRQLAQARQDAQDADRLANLAREFERAANLQARGVVVGAGAAGFAVAGSDPMMGPVVRNAPYSADAQTTVTQTLADGTRIERSATAKYYRDSAGRIRREQTIIGLDALNPSREQQTVITVVPDPDDAAAYQLDPVARTARLVGRAAGAFAGGSIVASVFTFSAPAYVVRWNAPVPAVAAAGDAVPPVEESLGTRQFEGVKATGRKTTTTIPTGAIGNDRPIEITDERWESPELGVLVYSRQSDPRTGVVEYRLTNIVRSEPPPDLFVVPPDYTVVGAPGLRTGGPGGRQGGGGARGAGARGRSPQ